MSERGGNATACDGSSGSLLVGSYDVWSGQSMPDDMGSPVVLKPLASGDVWCLVATAGVQGNPGGFYWPEASFSGYVAAGTLPAGTVADATAGAELGPQVTR